MKKDTFLTDLFSHYSHEKIIDYTQLPKTTSGNDAYVITTKDHKYVLRLLARQGGITPEEEYDLQLSLQKGGVVTPRYKQTFSGSLVTTHHNFTASLSDFIVGNRPEHITEALIASMGETLAKLHTALEDKHVTPNNLQWFDPFNVSNQLARYKGHQKQRIAELIEHASDILRRGLPQTLIHGDLHIHNIFASNEKVSAVFDLETASYTLRLFDIARTCLTLIKGSDLDTDRILSILIQGYDNTARKSLTKEERAALNEALAYVGATTALSIYNNGNARSSSVYIDLADEYMSKAL